MSAFKVAEGLAKGNTVWAQSHNDRHQTPNKITNLFILILFLLYSLFQSLINLQPKHHLKMKLAGA